MTPSDSIFPIVRFSSEGHAVQTMGTGFVCGDPLSCITAAHVLSRDHLKPGESYRQIMVDGDRRMHAVVIDAWTIHKNIDLAHFPAPDLKSIRGLNFLHGHCGQNDFVLCNEFSTTSHVRCDDGSYRVEFNPATHVGNILHYLTNPIEGSSGELCLKLSFPALQGASGAPVLRRSDYAVVGMVIANQEQDLIPAKTVRACFDGDEFEEVRYFLPSGIAIASEPIIAALGSVGIVLHVVRGNIQNRVVMARGVRQPQGSPPSE